MTLNNEGLADIASIPDSEIEAYAVQVTVGMFTEGLYVTQTVVQGEYTTSRHLTCRTGPNQIH